MWTMGETTGLPWWSELKHQGVLISPVVLQEYLSSGLPRLTEWKVAWLRDRFTRFIAAQTSTESIQKQPIYDWLDAIATGFLDHVPTRWLNRDKASALVTIQASNGDRIRPDRALLGSDGRPVMLVLVDPVARLGVGQSKKTHARLLTLLRGAGVKLGLLSNGRQIRLVYAGLDHEAWVEWETEGWFSGETGLAGLAGFVAMLGVPAFMANPGETFPLLGAVEASRTRQGELAQVLGDQIRQAVERLVRGLPVVMEKRQDLVDALAGTGRHALSAKEMNAALYQAGIRLVMRLVVILYAEARDLLPRGEATYHNSYSVERLFQLLNENRRLDRSEMETQRGAWLQLLSLFRLIHEGSVHPDLRLQPYGGELFARGDSQSSDAVRRALALFEADEFPGWDEEVYQVLRLLKIGRMAGGRGRKAVTGPVDFGDLRTEYIGIMYQGLLDYELRRVEADPIVVLGIGSQPAIRLSVLEGLDDTALRRFYKEFTKGKKVKATADDEAEEEVEEEVELEAPLEEVEGDETEIVEEEGEVEAAEAAPQLSHERALIWARRAVEVVGLVKGRRTADPALWEAKRERAAKALTVQVFEPGAYFLIQWGGTRKGSGSFYTRPQIAVPLTHRTLEPLCYEKREDGSRVPKRPEEILSLKVCDPAMGSGSFLVAALGYVTDALVEAVQYHGRLSTSSDGTVLDVLGRPTAGELNGELIPCPMGAPEFEERLRAMLKRYVVEQCIYGVDLNPLAVELARLSLWVETMDRSLPFEFLDHKLRVGNALVGCWLHNVADYPAVAWRRDAGDKKHEGVHFAKGVQTAWLANVYKERVIPELLDVVMAGAWKGDWAESPLDGLRARYQALHQQGRDEGDKEAFYQEQIVGSAEYQSLRRAMDRWCAIWFWPADGSAEPLTPVHFQHPTKAMEETVEALREKHRFFHWELEFPEVFVPGRPGFDAVLGNPPWEKSKPESQEFFTQYDPIYRLYDKKAGLARQKELFTQVPGAEAEWLAYQGTFRAQSHWVGNVRDPYSIALTQGKQSQVLSDNWAAVRAGRPAVVARNTPFQYQGGADLNMYKLFLEQAFFLLRHDGRLGFLVQGGIWSDAEVKDLRLLFLEHARWELLLGLSNERQIFSIHRSFTFATVVLTKGGMTGVVRTGFNTGPWSIFAEGASARLMGAGHWVDLSVEDIRKFSPEHLAFVTFNTLIDIEVCSQVLTGREIVGELVGRLQTVLFKREFDLTNDAARFTQRNRLELTGVLGTSDDVRDPRVQARLLKAGYLPLYQGKHVFQFDPAYSPKFEFFVQVKDKRLAPWKQLVWREVARATDTRTLIVAPTRAGAYAHKLWTISGLDSRSYGLYTAYLNSFTADYFIRLTQPGASVTKSVVETLPVPQFEASPSARAALVYWAEQLQIGDLAAADRLAIRCQSDAVVAHLFGLSAEQFSHILSTFPGVDKKRPSSQRQTTLTLECYRHLLAVGLDRFLTEGWQPSVPFAEGDRPGITTWAPPGGWDLAWAEAKAMLTPVEWAMLTGEYVTPTAQDEAAATQDSGTKKRTKKAKGQIELEL